MNALKNIFLRNLQNFIKSKLQFLLILDIFVLMHDFIILSVSCLTCIKKCCYIYKSKTFTQIHIFINHNIHSILMPFHSDEEST